MNPMIADKLNHDFKSHCQVRDQAKVSFLLLTLDQA